MGIEKSWKVNSLKNMTKATQLEKIEYVYKIYKDKVTSDLQDIDYQSQIDEITYELDMIQSEILQLCDNNSSIDKYKNVIKFAKTYGVNEHTYRACSMQGKPAINMKNCIHQMTKYLRSNKLGFEWD